MDLFKADLEKRNIQSLGVFIKSVAPVFTRNDRVISGTDNIETLSYEFNTQLLNKIKSNKDLLKRVFVDKEGVKGLTDAVGEYTSGLGEISKNPDYISIVSKAIIKEIISPETESDVKFRDDLLGVELDDDQEEPLIKELTKSEKKEKPKTTVSPDVLEQKKKEAEEKAKLTKEKQAVEEKTMNEALENFKQTSLNIVRTEKDRKVSAGLLKDAEKVLSDVFKGIKRSLDKDVVSRITREVAEIYTAELEQEQERLLLERNRKKAEEELAKKGGKRTKKPKP